MDHVKVDMVEPELAQAAIEPELAQAAIERAAERVRRRLERFWISSRTLRRTKFQLKIAKLAKSTGIDQDERCHKRNTTFAASQSGKSRTDGDPSGRAEERVQCVIQERMKSCSLFARHFSLMNCSVEALV
jgi:hypothetical protein